MKEGLIRLTDEKDIFYDSIEKVYRYRMHCPKCKTKINLCRCYDDLDILKGDIDDGIADYTCSYKCTLLINDWDWQEFHEAMVKLGLSIDERLCLEKLTDEQLKEAIGDYPFIDILDKLFFKKSKLSFEDLHNLKREQAIEIIEMMSDIDDILENYNIKKYPDIKDLTEEQAKMLVEVLTEDDEFDASSGENCSI